MGNQEVYLVIFVLSHVLTDKNVFIPQTKQSIWQCVLARPPGVAVKQQLRSPQPGRCLRRRPGLPGAVSLKLEA